MILLDTHILIWDALAPERLSPAATTSLQQANQGDGMLIADISLWEIAMLMQKGRLQVAAESHTFLNLILAANRLTVQPISAQIASLATQLPRLVNADPADRLIVATAIAAQAPLVTADRNLHHAARVPIIW